MYSLRAIVLHVWIVKPHDPVSKQAVPLWLYTLVSLFLDLSEREITPLFEKNGEITPSLEKIWEIEQYLQNINLQVIQFTCQIQFYYVLVGSFVKYIVC